MHNTEVLPSHSTDTVLKQHGESAAAIVHSRRWGLSVQLIERNWNGSHMKKNYFFMHWLLPLLFSLISEEGKHSYELNSAVPRAGFGVQILDYVTGRLIPRRNWPTLADSSTPRLLAGTAADQPKNIIGLIKKSHFLIFQ